MTNENDVITTLHPDQDPDTNLYPNIKKVNIPDGSIDLIKMDPDVVKMINKTPRLVQALPMTDEGVVLYTDGYLYDWDTYFHRYVSTNILYQAVNVQDGSITTAKLSDGAVTEDKIGIEAVTEDKIGSYAVTNSKLGDNSVYRRSIADGQVTSSKILDGAVTSSKLSIDLNNTINNKLDKVTTATSVMQAYVKLDNGTNQMLDVHWDNIRDTIPIRDQTSNIRVALTPTTNTHATSKQYVDNLVKKYNHFITAYFTDGNNNGYYGLFILQNNTDTQFNTTTFKRLFTLGQFLDSITQVIDLVCNQYGKSNNANVYSSCLFTYDSGQDVYMNNLNDYSNFLTLVSVQDTIKQL